MSIRAEIKKIEEELKRTPYNKATEKHIGRLKAKLARLKEKAEKIKSAKGQVAGIRKEGDATVVMVGYPSVGKSTLLNALTNAKSEVGDYEFTTLKPVPGILSYKGAKIQIIDTPGLIEGASSGRGRGKEILSIARIADLILLVTDIYNIDKLEMLKKELELSGIRLNRKPPVVTIKKKDKGGIRVAFTCQQTVSREAICEVLKEFGIHNADVIIRSEITIDDLVDVLMRNRVYIPAIEVINKVDLGKIDNGSSNTILISAKHGTNLSRLVEEIYKKLNLMRVYLKPPNEKQIEEPLVLKKGSTIEDVCRRLHKKMISDFKFARVWGKSVKFNGQKVGLDHRLEDGDVITIFLRK